MRTFLRVGPVLVLLGLLALPAPAGAVPPPAPPGAPPSTELADYAARRRALAREVGPGALVLVRAAGSRELAEVRQAPDFLWLTGVTVPDGAVLLDTGEAEGELETILFLPPHSRRRARWQGPRLAPGEGAREATGVDRVRPVGRLPGVWEERVEGRRPLSDDGEGPGGEPAGRVLPAIHRLRQVKTDLEIAHLREAVRITGTGILEALRSAEPGMAEHEIEAAAEYVFHRLGAEGTGFPTIAGSGPNSCILHYVRNDRRTEAGDLLVLDIGARVRGYTADVTRTFPVSGRFTDAQRAIYEVVLEAQEAAIEAVRPGATLRDVHAAAAGVIDEAGHGGAFLHGTSHWLGLDVHDVGPRGRELRPGMVLTVEPGIYLPDREIGVRIEDDVVVTADGREVLSRAIPRAPEAIESIMAEEGVGNVEIPPLEPAIGREF